MCAGEYAYLLHIFRLELDLPPMPVLRQLPPHGVAAAEKQNAPNFIFRGVCKIRMFDQWGKALAVSVIFLLEKLAAQELRDDFGFGNSAQLSHAASANSALLWPRKKGRATSASMAAISTIRTMMTSCSDPWKSPM